jgi:protocatechuate 4,5-dioxygenase, alpha chain
LVGTNLVFRSADGLRCKARPSYICQAGIEPHDVQRSFRAFLWEKPLMARKEQEYDDIPGTFVFDAERSREGYAINMFCMSLMKDENRQAFKANEVEYLKKFNLTPAQTEAILKRDYNRMLELGGNIYFTAKLGATDGHSFQHLAAVMTGSSQQDYAAMMLAGGRSVEGNRSKSGKVKPAGSKSKSKPKSKTSAKRK